jgi:hypothetical protein
MGLERKSIVCDAGAAHWFTTLIGAPADFSAALRRARATVSSWPGRPRRHPLPDASPSESLRAPPSRSSHQPRFTCRGSWPSRDLTRARPRSGRRIRGCAIQAPSLFQGPDGRWIRSPNRAEARLAVRPRAFRLSIDAKASTASLRSVLRFSQPLDGLLRARARGFVSPRCHVQDPSRSGCSPRARPPSLFERSCPLAVTRRPLTAVAAAMDVGSASRPSSVRECVASARVIHPREARSPPRVLLLQACVFSSRLRLTRSLRSCRYRLRSSLSRSPPCGRLQRIIHEKPDEIVSKIVSLLEFSSLPLDESYIDSSPARLPALSTSDSSFK